MSEFQWIYNMWTKGTSFSWIEMLAIGVLFMMLNLVFFLFMWFLRQEVAIEYGYPRRKRKYMRRKMSTHTFWERILLFKLTREAEKKGLMLYVNFLFHCFNISALIASIVGFVASMITLADGWALTLLTVSEISVSLFTLVLEFLPHLFCLESVRNKYKP